MIGAWVQRLPPSYLSPRCSRPFSRDRFPAAFTAPPGTARHIAGRRACSALLRLHAPGRCTWPLWCGRPWSPGGGRGSSPALPLLCWGTAGTEVGAGMPSIGRPAPANLAARLLSAVTRAGDMGVGAACCTGGIACSSEAAAGRSTLIGRPTPASSITERVFSSSAATAAAAALPLSSKPGGRAGGAPRLLPLPRTST